MTLKTTIACTKVKSRPVTALAARVPSPGHANTYSTVTGQPPASTMNTFATNPVLAQQQANSLNGNALRSLEQFKGTLVHAVWYFARVKDAFPAEATATATTAKRSSHFPFQGHKRATTR